VALNKRITEAKDAIINMHANGIAINAISRTLRIAPATIRKVLDEWRVTVGPVARGRARLAESIDPACERIAKAVKTDDRAAFRLLEGMGVLGVDSAGRIIDKSISNSISILLASSTPTTPSTHSTPSTTSTDMSGSEPSSREDPPRSMQLHDSTQNFAEIVDVIENKGVTDDGQSV
jgi:hypothetical protein